MAAKEYASDNRYNNEFIGRINEDVFVMTINAQELFDKKYLNGDIVNPYDKRTIPPSEVTINIYFYSDYTVKAVLIGGNEILKDCNCQTIPDDNSVVPPAIGNDDITPPVITYSLKGGIHKGLQTLTITVADDKTGVDYMSVEVYKDGNYVSEKSISKTSKTSFKVELDKYSVWKVYTRAYDKAGNRSNQNPQTDDGKYYQEYEIIGKPIYIYYHRTEGTLSGKCRVGDGELKTCNEYNGWASVGTTYAYQICRVDTECNLWNHKTTNYLNITRSGYETKTGQEWKADRTGTIFDENKNYTYEELKASNYQEKELNYELNLRVNWVLYATITCADKTYNGSNQTIASCSGGTVNNQTQKEVGSYTITCTADEDHLDASNKTCKINKADATCPTLTAYSGTYDGNSHTITVSGGSGGTIQYRTSTTDSWTTTKPSRSSVGTTTVYVQVAGDANHNTKDCGSKTITISDAFTSNTGSGACAHTFSVCNGRSLTCRGNWNGWTNEDCGTKDGPKNYHKCLINCSYTCNGESTTISGDYQADGTASTSCCTYANKDACVSSDPNGTWHCKTNKYGCWTHFSLSCNTGYTASNSSCKCNTGYTSCPSNPSHGSYSCTKRGENCYSVSGPTCDYGYHSCGSASCCRNTTAATQTKSGTKKTGGGTGCFPAGTKVTTTTGYKDIDKLKLGDMVLSYNEETGLNEYHEVVYLFRYEPSDIDEELYTLTFDDKNTLNVTSSHKFYIKTADGYEILEAKDIKVDDYVMYADYTYHKVTKIKHKKLKESVYNISVENTHNFYIDSEQILVHNVGIKKLQSEVNVPK